MLYAMPDAPHQQSLLGVFPLNSTFESHLQGPAPLHSSALVGPNCGSCSPQLTHRADGAEVLLNPRFELVMGHSVDVRAASGPRYSRKIWPAPARYFVTKH